jgi:hypothetical protein
MMEPTATDAPQPHRLRMPFAARFQGILIGVLFLALVLIAQQRSKDLYQIGLPMLMVAAFLQIAFGNIPPRTNFAKSIVLLAMTWLIIGSLFALSVWLAPSLIDATR